MLQSTQGKTFLSFAERQYVWLMTFKVAAAGLKPHQTPPKATLKGRATWLSTSRTLSFYRP